MEAHFNRIAGNATGAETLAPARRCNADNNWWGCNEGPGQTGCEQHQRVRAPRTPDPWLVLGASAGPGTVQTGGTSQVTATLSGQLERRERRRRLPERDADRLHCDAGVG